MQDFEIDEFSPVRPPPSDEGLDHLVSIIKELPGITKASKILGISYKENSTLERFNKLGFNKTISLDLDKDIGNDQKGAGIETIQEKFQPDLAENLIQKYGKADIVIVRHILEHAYNPLRFMKALKIMVKKSGFVVFEIPDCTTSLENYDYTMTWEEHIIYLTPYTFKNLLRYYGFNIIFYHEYPYPHENLLFARFARFATYLSSFVILLCLSVDKCIL
jgi:hypothetical protein